MDQLRRKKLLVDDEAAIRHLFSAFLPETDIPSGKQRTAEASILFSPYASTNDPVLTDLEMARRHGFEQPVVFLSGYYNEARPKARPFECPIKPFTRGQLIGMVERG